MIRMNGRKIGIAGLLGAEGIALAGFLLFGSQAPPPGSGEEKILAIVNGRIIDGTGAPPVENGAVLIRGNRIAAVGPKSRVTIPAEAVIRDAGGGTILPGLIDSHVHNAFTPSVRRKFLEAGITSVCDLGSPIRRMPEFSRSQDRGLPVARGFKAGPIFTAPGGLPDAVLKEDLNYEAGSPHQAREGVRDVARRGADVIKVYLHPTAGGRSYPTLDEDTLEAIVREAHSQNKIVRAHATQIEALPLALKTGVDVVDHIPRPDLSPERLNKELKSSPEPMKALYALVRTPAYDILLPRLVKQKTALVTTLALILGDFLDPRKSTEAQQTVVRAIFDILRQFRDLGGVIALGTDYNANGKWDPAELYFKEIDILAAAGLSPLETIAAATGNAAAVSGHGYDLGTLAPGKLADILIVGGNPLEDMGALRKIEAVILDGMIVVE